MSYLQNNLSILKQFDKILYQRIEEWLANRQEESLFSVLPAKNGNPTLQYFDGTRTKYLLSAYDPALEGQRWAEKQQTANLYVVYGFGMAYHLPALKREDVERILIIEPSMEVFIHALEHMDLSWLWGENLYILAVAEEDYLVVRRLNWIVTESYAKILEFTALTSYIHLYEESYYSLQKHFNEILGASIIRVNTYNKHAKMWTENFFGNLLDTLKSPRVNGLFGKFTDIPVIIIAAGPSLSKNMHLLHQLKNKALLFCVGTAYKALRSEGIKPHFIVSFDGGVANYWQFQDIEITDIPLIFDPVIYRDIVKEYKGPLVAANISNTLMEWVEKELDFELGEILVGPSVANVTFDLARKVGGNPLIFIGQDLAFTDGKSHAEGTVYGKIRHVSTGNLSDVFIEDIYGQSVLTNRSWQTFLRWFEREVANTSDRIVIDATEGGAKISGTTIMPLHEVIGKYCIEDYPIEAMIAKFFADFTHPGNGFLEKGMLLLDKIQEEIDGFKKSAKKGLNQLEELKILIRRPEVNHREIQKVLRQLDKVDEQLISFEDGKVFLQIIFQPLVMPILNGRDAKPVPGESPEEEQARIIRHCTNLYTGLKDIAEIVLEMIEKSRKDFKKELNCALREEFKNDK